MKISPLKNYAKPKYAVKLAALLAAAVSVSACSEGGSGSVNTSSSGGGAGYKPQTTTEVTELAGEVDTTTEYVEPDLAGEAMPDPDYWTQLEGDVAVVETTPEPQVVGMLQEPEETDTTGEGIFKGLAMTTAALAGGTAAAGTTTYNEVELSGEVDTTSEYDEPQLMGDFPVTEYNEPELEGDVYAPEYLEPQLEGGATVPEYEPPVAEGVAPMIEENGCKSDGCIFAERNLCVLKNAFEAYDGISFTFVEGFDDPGHGRFRITDADGKIYNVPAPYMIENKNADDYTDMYAFVTYMTSDDEYAEFIRKNGTALYGAYIYVDESTGLRLVLIDYDGEGADLDEDACVKLAISYGKAVGIS